MTGALTRSRRWLAVAGAMLGTGYLTLTVILGLLATVPMVWGWQPHVIVSDSMAPAVRAGTVVVVADSNGSVPRRGHIVVFPRPGHPGQLLAHRVVGYTETGQLLTGGDANPKADSAPVSPALVRGTVRLVVPMIGAPVLWLAQHRWLDLVGWTVLTGLAASLTVGYARPDKPAGLAT